MHFRKKLQINIFKRLLELKIKINFHLIKSKKKKKNRINYSYYQFKRDISMYNK